MQGCKSSDRDDYGVNANCSRTAVCFRTVLAVTPSTPPASLAGFDLVGVGAGVGVCVVVVPVVASVVVVGLVVARLTAVVVDGGTVVV